MTGSKELLILAKAIIVLETSWTLKQPLFCMMHLSINSSYALSHVARHLGYNINVILSFSLFRRESLLSWEYTTRCPSRNPTIHELVLTRAYCNLAAHRLWSYCLQA